MAKDPAFLFYPGDAAEDVSHMNRLERGAYFDFVQAQKKFGALSIIMIKKILGKDFDSVWDALKMCLTYEKDMYFIAWLHDSIEKRKKYSASRANNRKGQNQTKNKDSHSTYVNHMENVNGIVNGIRNEEEGGVGETLDQRLTSAFDASTLETLCLTFRNKNVTDELQTFITKVRGSPQSYRHHDVNGLRLAFNYQLRNTKSNANTSKTEQRTRTLVADFAQRAGAIPDQ